MKPQDSVQIIPGIGPKKSAELSEFGIETVQDLISHMPFRYEDASQVLLFSQLELGQLATVEAEVLSVKSFRTRNRVPMTNVEILDDEGDVLNGLRITVAAEDQLFTVRDVLVVGHAGDVIDDSVVAP